MADCERSFKFNYEFDWPVNPHPGFFGVVEGLDGSGNSTQIQRLAEGYFYDDLGITGKFIKVEKEPTYGVFGAPVNYALRRKLEVDDLTLQMGFSTDRSDHLTYGGVLDWLKVPGNVFLMDRYAASTIAFGYAAGLDINFLIAMQSKFTLPDEMFFLDTPPEVCMERLEKRAEGKPLDRFETLEKLRKAREWYLLLMDKIPGLITRIDGNRGVREITQDIISIIEKNPKRRSGV